MKMMICFAIGAMSLVACGPSWSDVVEYPDGTIENPETGECWRDTVPVQCPSTHAEDE